jgi:DNA gyrase subunit B
LYKVKLGKSERYLKDDHERDQFMLSQALIDASLIPRAGTDSIKGEALEALAKSYLLSEAVIQRLSRIVDIEVLKALSRGVTADMSDAQAAADSAERLRRAMPSTATSASAPMPRASARSSSRTVPSSPSGPTPAW